MNKKEIRNYNFLNIEINAIEEEIKLFKNNMIRNKLKKAICQNIEKKAIIDNFLELIEDQEIKKAITFKYINGCSWNKTNSEISPFINSDYLRKKTERFLNNNIF